MPQNSSASQSVLSVRGLSVWHSTAGIKKSILTNISLDLKQDDFLCIIGMSGGGKSTLLRALCGLLPPNLTMAYRSYELAHQRTKQSSIQSFLGKQISIVFQDPVASLNPTLSIQKQFQLALQEQPGSRHGDQGFRKAILDRLREVQITDPEQVLGKYPAELSGGMNQRVNIALGLINNPEILLLDEPTSALDKDRRDVIMRILSHIKQERSLSIIFVTHDIHLVQNAATNVLVLNKGRIIEQANRNSKGINPRKVNSKSIATWSELQPQSFNVKDGNEKVLDIRNLTKSFNEDHLALKNISFSIRNGECFGVMGPSGGGKSTLAKIIASYLSLSSGQIITRPKLRVELVDQGVSESLNPCHPVSTILNEDRKIQGRKNRSTAELRAYLQKVDLPQVILDTQVSRLSGGQQQRIAIVRALLANPDVLILDEPTSALDVQTQKNVLYTLKQLNTQQGITCIIMSHDPDVIYYLCSSYIVIDQSVVLKGAPNYNKPRSKV